MTTNTATDSTSICSRCATRAIRDALTTPQPQTSAVRRPGLTANANGGYGAYRVINGTRRNLGDHDNLQDALQAIADDARRDSLLAQAEQFDAESMALEFKAKSLRELARGINDQR